MDELELIIEVLTIVGGGAVAPALAIVKIVDKLAKAKRLRELFGW